MRTRRDRDDRRQEQQRQRVEWPVRRVASGGARFGPWRAPGYPSPRGRYDETPMRRLSLLLAALSLLALWPRRPAPPRRRCVEVLKVEGAIDRPLLGYLNDRWTPPRSRGAIVVLQIDTAGTLDQDGVALAQRVAELSVPVDRVGGTRARPCERRRARC